MNDVGRLLLRDLLHGRRTATLATLHEGRPAASMIPFAIGRSTDGIRLVTHVSRLAAHTRQMLESPEVCLLIMAPEDAALPQALPRVSIPAVAEFVPPDHPDHVRLKAAYLAKHPQAADLFQLGDFSIVAFTPLSARFVAGFGAAHTLRPEVLAAMAEAGIV
ncbi:MAG: pyridoxamine 5'-phosphate oxidase family protein [Planctomycetia bacterium]